MSVFNEVIVAHEKAKAEAASKEEKQLALQQEKDAAFRKYFDEMVKELLLPVGAEFARDAEAYGFPSKINTKPDGDGNPYFSISLIPKKGATFSDRYTNADTVVFALQGLGGERKILVSSYFDQRSEHGVHKQRISPSDVTPDWFNAQLKGFLSKVLKTHDSN